MATYRNALPQLRGDLFMTDGGFETTLIFLDGQQFPDFAAFELLKTPEGIEAIRKYLRSYGALAKRLGLGMVLETPTWRANPDWGTKLGYDAKALEQVNRTSVRLLEEIRAEFEAPGAPIVISGLLGPRGDGYVVDKAMTATEAEDYHGPQIRTFADTAADLVSVLTINYVEEGIGVAMAAKRANMPVVISFTLETDGNLPTGQTLGDAIAQVDAASSTYPAYYMINCAHPTHFANVLHPEAAWTPRLRGIRANASKMSHAELNEAPELDAGNPVELGQEFAELRTQHLPHLNIVGGCCGTDVRHVEQVALACRPLVPKASHA
ncbi:MAG: homocysteine S-methyltransferase family protein [Kofleriaceae bacterium]|nr:homocysteine S-methyltransferase family protein [Kofleriaceae bacterium]